MFHPKPDFAFQTLYQLLGGEEYIPRSTWSTSRTFLIDPNLHLIPEPYKNTVYIPTTTRTIPTMVKRLK